MKDKIERIIADVCYWASNEDDVSNGPGIARDKILSLLHSALEEQKRKYIREIDEEIETLGDGMKALHTNEALIRAINLIDTTPFPEGIEINDGWVSVKDRLPEDNGYGESKYLALLINDGIEEPFWIQGRYDHCKLEWHSMEEQVDDDIVYTKLNNVTHWKEINPYKVKI